MFIQKIRADSGNDTRSPWGSFWFSPLGMSTASGMSVTSSRAMQSTAVAASVRVLAESFSVLPLRAYKIDLKTGKRTRLYQHWMLDLFRRPNPYQNGYEWRQMCQGHLAYRGNCFNYIVDDANGEPTMLQPMHPDRVRIELIGDSDWRYAYTMRDGTTRRFAREQVWHLKGLSPDGIVGYSPLDLAREAIGLALAAQDYGARFFMNDTKTTGWIEHPGHFKDQDARKKWRDNWQEQQGGENRYKLPVLEYGMKYHELGMTNKESQFLEARQYQVSDIARVFRLPPHMIGDLSRSTNNNIEQQSLEFVVYTMTPWAECWEAGQEYGLLPDNDGSIEFEYDFSRLLRGDSEARSMFYHYGIADGWLTRNEAREEESRERIDGLDEPLVAVNMTTADKVGEDPAPAGADAPLPQRRGSKSKPSKNNDDAGDDENARFAALVASNAARMGLRIAKGKKPSTLALAESLAITEDQARAFLSNVKPAAAGDIATQLVALATKE